MPQLQHPMTIHVYHPYRQPDGENFCQAVNGHCSHLCLPAPKITDRSPRISCACPTGLKLMDDGLMCVEDGEFAHFPLVDCGSGGEKLNDDETNGKRENRFPSIIIY
jgi:Coagulation Factor Xa inhibitory site